MAYVNEHLMEAVQILRKLPNRTWFDTSIDGIKSLDFQANSQSDLKKLTAILPVRKWTKNYCKETAWWNYTGVWNGWRFRIYEGQGAGSTYFPRGRGR